MTREEANRIADAILEAESAERERCAKMLESEAEDLRCRQDGSRKNWDKAEVLDEAE